MRRALPRRAVRMACPGPFRRALLEFGEVHGGGPFLSALAASVERAGHTAVTTSRYRRALLRPAASAEEYEAAAIPARRRRECRRRLKRLRERGSVAFSDLGAGEDPASWFRAFLTLERSGWKGRRGSAMLARGHDGFFEEMAGGAHARGQLGMSQLAIDGRPVAMGCRLRSGRGGIRVQDCVRRGHCALLTRHPARAAQHPAHARTEGDRMGRLVREARRTSSRPSGASGGRFDTVLVGSTAFPSARPREDGGGMVAADFVVLVASVLTPAQMLN